MSSPPSLQTLIELAQNRADEAARALGATNAQEQEDEKKLQTLLHYRREYQAQFQAAARNGLDPAAWRNYCEFIRKLDAAIVQQQEVLALVRQKLHSRQREWQRANQKLQSFSTLSQRHRRAQLHKERRKEQQEQDEHASKSMFRLARGN